MSLAADKRGIRITSWALQIAIAAAFVLVGALPKLTGQEPSIELFEKLGQPWARVPVGLMELAAAVLVLLPKTARWGSAFCALVMLGAIGSHVATPLGTAPVLTIDGVSEAHPELMFMAFGLLALSAVVFVLRRPRAGS